MSSYEATSVYLHGILRFRTVGYSNPIVLPPDGILVLNNDNSSRVVLANGSILKGIRITWPDGNQTIDTEWDDDDTCMIIMSAEDGGLITVIHDAIDVVDPIERISVSDNSNTIIDNKHVQIFSQFVPSVGGRRWRINDWAGI